MGYECLDRNPVSQIQKSGLNTALLYGWMGRQTALPDVVVWANWFQKQPKIGKKFSRANKQTWSCKERTWKRTFFIPRPNLALRRR
jgi:hypothetical protein